MVDRTCEHCGATFSAKRRSSRFCSDPCRAARHRGRSNRTIAIGATHSPSRDAISTIRVSNPAETLDIMMGKAGTLPEPPSSPLRWEMVNPAHHKLTDGVRVRPEGPLDPPTTRAVAWAFDKGQTERASWCAACKKITIGPAWMVAAGLSDTPGLAEARLVAMAMATGDVRPLVLAAHQLDDCTDDMRLALAGMSSLLPLLHSEADDGPKLPVEESTELPDFETEEIMVVRLNRDWCVVEAEGFWILQHRLGDGDDWEWAGRINRRPTLLHAVGHLVDEVEDEAWAVLDALPEKPRTAPS